MNTWTDDHGLKRNVMDVFVSYGRADRSHVAKIIQQLRNEGLSVFWDQDIPPGTPFDSFLAKALDSSRIVLVVWSCQSIQSEWMFAEAELARECKRLVACKIDDCRPRLPFNTFQTVDLSAWNGIPTDPMWRSVADLIIHRVTAGDAQQSIGRVRSEVSSPLSDA